MIMFSIVEAAPRFMMIDPVTYLAQKRRNASVKQRVRYPRWRISPFLF